MPRSIFHCCYSRFLHLSDSSFQMLMATLLYYMVFHSLGITCHSSHAQDILLDQHWTHLFLVIDVLSHSRMPWSCFSFFAFFPSLLFWWWWFWLFNIGSSMCCSVSICILMTWAFLVVCTPLQLMCYVSCSEYLHARQCLVWLCIISNL